MSEAHKWFESVLGPIKGGIALAFFQKIQSGEMTLDQAMAECHAREAAEPVQDAQSRTLWDSVRKALADKVKSGV